MLQHGKICIDIDAKNNFTGIHFHHRGPVDPGKVIASKKGRKIPKFILLAPGNNDPFIIPCSIQWNEEIIILNTQRNICVPTAYIEKIR